MIRASSRLSLEDGSATSWCWALAALRKRVRKSATGSVIDMARRSPTRLRHAGDVSVVRQLAQADPADAELAVDRAGATAAAATGVTPGLVLGRPLLADSLRKLGHVLLLILVGGRRLGTALLRKRHPERLQQGERFFVAGGARRDRDVETAHLIDLVVVDLGEDDLLTHAHRVVPAAVERAWIEPAEVPDSGDRYRHQPVEELIRALAAQRDGHTDGHTLPHLELRDRLARPAHARSLAGDRRQLLGRGIEHLGVLLGLADAHVYRDLLDPRRLHRGRVAKALDQGRSDLLQIPALQS